MDPNNTPTNQGQGPATGPLPEKPVNPVGTPTGMPAAPVPPANPVPGSMPPASTEIPLSEVPQGPKPEVNQPASGAQGNSGTGGQVPPAQ